MDPLLRYVQEDAAHDLATAAENLAYTIELLTAAHTMATATSDPAAGELLAAIAKMTAVRDSLHDHAATLAAAGLPR